MVRGVLRLSVLIEFGSPKGHLFADSNLQFDRVVDLIRLFRY